MWISLGPNWTQTIDINLLKASRLPSSFQPIFSDGWAPIVGELELIGLVAPPQAVGPPSSTQLNHQHNNSSILSASDCQSTAPANGELINNGSNDAHHHQHHQHHHHHSRSSRTHHQALNLSTPYLQTDTLASDSTAIVAAESHSIYSAGANVSTNGKSGGSRKKGNFLAPAASGAQPPPPLPPPTGATRASRHYQHDLVGDQLVQAVPPQLDPLDQLPYNSVPYGYLVDGQPVSGSQNAPSGRRSRAPKGSSQYAGGGESFGPTISSGYEDVSHNYPTMSISGTQGALFTEDEEDHQLAHHQVPSSRHHHQYQRHHHTNGAGAMMMHSDGYSDLQDPYMSGAMINSSSSSDQLHSKSAPVNHHHHNHHPHVSQHPSHPHQGYHSRSGGGGGGNSRFRGAEKGAHSAKMSSHGHLYGPPAGHHLQHLAVQPPGADEYLLSDAEHEAMLIDFGPAQAEWFYELQARGALIVRVLFTREANNDKELSVHRGELLEVLDDTRKWWRARNIELQVAHVPHTIVAVMQGYQTLDELLANQPALEVDDSILINNSSTAKMYSRRDVTPLAIGGHHKPINQMQPSMPMQLNNNNNNNFNSNNNQHWRAEKEAKRASSNSKTAGAFRYF